MSARRSTGSTIGSSRNVSREAEREARIQDIIAQVMGLMAEDADANEELAKKTLLKAHRAAKEARHWGDIGKCWFHYFLDFDRADSCFSKAVEIAFRQGRPYRLWSTASERLTTKARCSGTLLVTGWCPPECISNRCSR